MRKVLVLSLVAAVVAVILILTPIVALAAEYDAPVSGESPHAGWTTTSDQCKQCHAVHKATGNRFLLRSKDSRYNDCAFCHEDGSGGAGYDVYSQNLYNGHTLGSVGTITSPYAKTTIDKARPSRVTSDGRILIPDYGSTVSTADAVTGARSYRGGGVAVSPSQAYVGLNTTQEVTATAGGGLRTNSQTTFNCNSCHMAHANPEKVITWRFLSLNPFARTRDTTGLYTYYGPEWPNYKDLSGVRSAVPSARTVNTTSLTNKILVRNPNDKTSGQLYNYDEATARAAGNRVQALTEWCADCHNMNVMGPGMKDPTDVKDAEQYYDTPLGYSGITNEYGRWYSHSTAWNISGDYYILSNGEIKTKSNPPEAGNYPTTAFAPGCQDCHVGFGYDYLTNVDVGQPTKGTLYAGGRTNTYDPAISASEQWPGEGWNYSDWPHTGTDNSYALLKMLPQRPAASSMANTFTPIVNAGTDASTYDAAGLDNVCRQCHANVLRDPGTINFDNSSDATNSGGFFDNTWPGGLPGP